MKEARIPVAGEGYPFILFALFTTLIVAVLQMKFLAIAGLVVSGLVLNFFRDPDRIIPEDPDCFVSPADGKVIKIVKIFDDKFVNEHVYKISVFMNIFNVHVNRTPFDGKVLGIKYAPGKFFSANTDRAALENEQCGVIMETANQQTFAFVQIAGLVARRIVCWAEKGDTLRRGQRFGLIRFGSRVDLYLPQNMQIEVAIGQKVKAGETVIGYLPSSS